MKMGYCPLCGNHDPKPLIKDFCQYHYWQAKKKPIERKPVRIAPASKKRLQALERYRRLREKHFKECPVCQYPGCNSTQVTLHHSAGRIGAFLTDKRYFKSLCWPHHRFCEENPILARKLGLSVDRTNK